MRLLKIIPAVLLAFFAGAAISCGGDSSGPDPVDPNSIEGQIAALFPDAPGLRDAALAKATSLRQKVAQNAATQARAEALGLVDLTLTSFMAAKLTGGPATTTQTAVARLVAAVYQLAGMPAPNLPLGSDGAAQVVGPQGGQVVTGTGSAGVVIPAGTFSEPVLVTIERLPSTPAPGSGPLPTNLKQYPPYYEYATSPAVLQFGDSVRVGVCQVTDASSPLYPPEPHDRLRLAHRVGTTIEILERVDVSDFLRCSSVSPSVSISPDLPTGRGAVRAHGGLGGKTKSFSPFGAVDPFSGPVASVTVTITPSTIRVNENALATAVLKDANGNVLTGRSVSWSAGASPFASIGATTGIVLGAAAGTATITASSEGQTGSATLAVGPALLTAIAVSAGSFHTCALLGTGEANCWGGNSTGELGDGTSTDRLTPTPVAGNLTFSTVSTGDGYTCAISIAGPSYCWGRNNSGQLGDGTTTNRRTPTLVSGGFSFVAIYAYGGHACGLTASGAGYCWGSGLNGALGDGTRTDRAVPTPIAGNLTFKTLAVGAVHTCGLTVAGQAYCWGYNTGGQIGDGTRGSSQTGTTPSSPKLVIGGVALESLVAGQWQNCGLVSGGQGYCWGYNVNGELGDGTTIERDSPTAMVGGLTFSRLEAGTFSACGITTGGIAYCWGLNNFGQVGDGTAGNTRLTPTRVSGTVSFSSVTAGWNHSCGLGSTGTVFCWGSNVSGRLGDGTQTNRLVPTPVTRP